MGGGGEEVGEGGGALVGGAGVREFFSFSFTKNPNMEIKKNFEGGGGGRRGRGG